MGETIALITFIGSILGMGIIVFRKIPLLSTLSEIEISRKDGLMAKLKKKLKDSSPLKNFSFESFLQKLLYKIRILTLKADVKTWNWIQKLKERSQKKRLENDNYWDEIKKSLKKK